MHTQYQPQSEFDSEQRKLNAYINHSTDRVIRRRREIQYLVSESKGSTPGKRPEITSFTPAASNRLRRYIDNYYADFETMVTLTYGATWPTDGRVVKRHLAAWFERLRRQTTLQDGVSWMTEYSLVWWLEFQERGAPHIHMVATGWISKSWAAEAWAHITGGDVTACCRVEGLRDSDAVGAYAAKYAAKSDQKTVPPGYENVGRFWGRRGRRPFAGPCVPRQVVAATGTSRMDARRWLRACAEARERARTHADAHAGARARAIVRVGGLALPSIRVYKHDGGFSIYGSTRDIQFVIEHINELSGGFECPS